MLSRGLGMLEGRFRHLLRFLRVESESRSVQGCQQVFQGRLQAFPAFEGAPAQLPRRQFRSEQPKSQLQAVTPPCCEWLRHAGANSAFS